MPDAGAFLPEGAVLRSCPNDHIGKSANKYTDPEKKYAPGPRGQSTWPRHQEVEQDPFDAVETHPSIPGHGVDADGQPMAISHPAQPQLAEGLRFEPVLDLESQTVLIKLHLPSAASAFQGRQAALP